MSKTIRAIDSSSSSSSSQTKRRATQTLLLHSMQRNQLLPTRLQPRQQDEGLMWTRTVSLRALVRFHGERQLKAACRTSNIMLLQGTSHERDVRSP